MKRTLFLASFLMAACHRGSGNDPAPTVVSVRVANAEIGAIAQPIEVVGTIAASREATLSSKINAQIARMPLLTNRAVHAGDVLAVLESRDLGAQRSESKAALATAKDAIAPAEAALENARRTYERRKDLYARGGISKKELESSQLDVANAAGALKMANSRVAEALNRSASADAQLGYSEIRAPFDGIVTEQFLHEGDFAASGNRLLTIADGSNVIVKAPLSDEAATHVHAGDSATIQPDDLPGTTLRARVSLVARAADPQNRSVEVWIALPNRDGRLRPNGSARVTIASSAVAGAVIVPTQAITLDATNANRGTVMIVDANSIAHEVHVTTGLHDQSRTQITAGLRGGETVVVDGNYGLPDGTKVTVAAP